MITLVLIATVEMVGDLHGGEGVLPSPIQEGLVLVDPVLLLRSLA